MIKGIFKTADSDSTFIGAQKFMVIWNNTGYTKVKNDTITPCKG